jgi:hypothetical protein
MKMSVEFYFVPYVGFLPFKFGMERESCQQIPPIAVVEGEHALSEIHNYGAMWFSNESEILVGQCMTRSFAPQLSHWQLPLWFKELDLCNDLRATFRLLAQEDVPLECRGRVYFFNLGLELPEFSEDADSFTICAYSKEWQEKEFPLKNETKPYTVPRG